MDFANRVVDPAGNWGFVPLNVQSVAVPLVREVVVVAEARASIRCGVPRDRR